MDHIARKGIACVNEYAHKLMQAPLQALRGLGRNAGYVQMSMLACARYCTFPITPCINLPYCTDIARAQQGNCDIFSYNSNSGCGVVQGRRFNIKIMHPNLFGKFLVNW